MIREDGYCDLENMNMYYHVSNLQKIEDCKKTDDEDITFEEKIKQLAEKLESNESNDNVNHPAHYTSHPSGVECIEITRHYCFAIGNAIKYLWRAGLKQEADKDSREKEIEDLQKAVWYINDRIKQLKGEQ